MEKNKKTNKSTANVKKVQSVLVYETYLVLDNERAFYDRIQRHIKSKNKLPSLTELDKLVVTGYNQYVKSYIDLKDRKYFDEKVCRSVSKKLLVKYKEIFEYEKKYKKKNN